MTLSSVLVDAARDNFSNFTGMRCCSYMESENYYSRYLSVYVPYKCQGFCFNSVLQCDNNK